MINYLHSLWRRPENGWDPVPYIHVQNYAERVWNEGVDEKVVLLLDEWIGGFAGKRVLDLGGGPGQWSIAFAKRGAHVTWHDISSGYRSFAENKANEHGVKVDFSVGYLDEARCVLEGEFDLVFNRVCWYYSQSDFSFAKTFYSLIKEGGVGYIDTHPSTWRRENIPLIALARTWLNDSLGLKIGHPFPPRGRIARLFSDMPIEKIFIDYSTPSNERIIFRRI